MKFGVQLFEASGQYSTLAPEVCSQDLGYGFLDPTRQRQRERQKTIGLVGKTTASHVHHAFLYISLPFWTTATWTYLISRFMENVNKQQRIYISLTEFGYGS